MIYSHAYFILDADAKSVRDENGRLLPVHGQSYALLELLCRQGQASVEEVRLAVGSELRGNHAHQLAHNLRLALGQPVIGVRQQTFFLVGEAKPCDSSAASPPVPDEPVKPTVVSKAAALVKSRQARPVVKAFKQWLMLNWVMVAGGIITALTTGWLWIAQHVQAYRHPEPTPVVQTVTTSTDPVVSETATSTPMDASSDQPPDQIQPSDPAAASDPSAADASTSTDQTPSSDGSAAPDPAAQDQAPATDSGQAVTDTSIDPSASSDPAASDPSADPSVPPDQSAGTP